MHDLRKYAEECMAELDRLGIKYARDIRFTVNSRAVTRLGQCRKKGDSYVVEISSALLDERVDVKTGLKCTLHHELLHTCCGCMKHTGRWKVYADRVNAAYGYRIQRASTREERPLPEDLVPKAKYLIVCDTCGAQFPRQKISALVRNPEHYRCGKCGGKLKRVAP